ncbi:hypothetical protein [Fusobacterium polymorphum]|uniref:hypothetical protein n=1 Tax=Fusobacterium nucleatum subsp. polymorphum TaxID=76857 RepID=UPI00300BA6E1
MLNFYNINKFILSKISKKSMNDFFISYKEQKNILEEIYKKEFDDTYFSRSYCQYLCQKKIYKQNYYFLNFLSLFIINFLIILFKFFSKKIIKKEKIEIIYFGIEKTIPKKFLKYKMKKLENHFFLTEEDIKYFKMNILKKSKGQYYFALKILLKIATYRYNIEKYSPRIFLVTSEYSWTSSLLTEFCEKNKISHINYMHGDKKYYIRDSFFKFHKCYIWDEHYEKIFCELKSFKKQFEIIDYSSFIPKIEIKEKLYNTYYLQADETIEDINKIIKILKSLEIKTGYIGKIRCHPVYTSEKIKKVVPIEMLDLEKNIYYSIEMSNYIISKTSTVLYEAYIMGSNSIVIDDLTQNKNNYNCLKELKWISISKPHQRLSEII